MVYDPQDDNPEAFKVRLIGGMTGTSGPTRVHIVTEAATPEPCDHSSTTVDRASSGSSGTSIPRPPEDRRRLAAASRSAVFVQPIEGPDPPATSSAFPSSKPRTDFDVHRDITRILAPPTALHCSGCWSVDMCRSVNTPLTVTPTGLASASPCGWARADGHFSFPAVETETI